jgi:hypothetical protein
MGNSTIRTANIHGYLANRNLGFFEAFSENQSCVNEFANVQRNFKLSPQCIYFEKKL